jgi:chromosome segregation ATPase
MSQTLKQQNQALREEISKLRYEIAGWEASYENHVNSKVDESAEIHFLKESNKRMNSLIEGFQTQIESFLDEDTEEDGDSDES